MWKFLLLELHIVNDVIVYDVINNDKASKNITQKFSDLKRNGETHSLMEEFSQFSQLIQRASIKRIKNADKFVVTVNTMNKYKTLHLTVLQYTFQILI